MEAHFPTWGQHGATRKLRVGQLLVARRESFARVRRVNQGQAAAAPFRWQRPAGGRWRASKTVRPQQVRRIAREFNSHSSASMSATTAWEWAAAHFAKCATRGKGTCAICLPRKRLSLRTDCSVRPRSSFSVKGRSSGPGAERGLPISGERRVETRVGTRRGDRAGGGPERPCAHRSTPSPPARTRASPGSACCRRGCGR